jgi:hypothetical protein
MENPSKHRSVRMFAVAAMLAVACSLLAARPAAAQQIWIAPDRSIVNFGPPRPFPINPFFSTTPVVFNGNSWVSVGGNFSFGFWNPIGGFPGTGFIKPFTANDRARAANFYGSPGYNPNPVITGPFQAWWK